MTALFKKHKSSILYWTILLFFLLYFSPRQSKYYLDQDIKLFKALYLVPTLMWFFGLIAVGLFVFWLLKTKSIRQSTIGFLLISLFFTLIFFITQNIFLGIALFINRQIAKGETTKTYQASFMTGVDNSKSKFYLYEPSTGQIINDRKLINELYKSELKQNDKIILPMKIGLFGVTFISHPLN